MFHLFKQCRIYSGRAYCGPTSYCVPAAYGSLAEAIAARDDFNARNPVGWSIYDAITGEEIDC